MSKLTFNNVDFTVTQLDDGMWALEADTPLHHATWKKCVKESGLDVCYGDWQSGNMMTWDGDKIKLQLMSDDELIQELSFN